MKLQALEGVQVASLPCPTAARRDWGGPQPQSTGKPRGDRKGHGNMAWSRELLGSSCSGHDCATSAHPTSHGTEQSGTSKLAAVDGLI